jgi:hypothetical protein
MEEKTAGLPQSARCTPHRTLFIAFRFLMTSQFIPEYSFVQEVADERVFELPDDPTPDRCRRSEPTHQGVTLFFGAVWKDSA